MKLYEALRNVDTSNPQYVDTEELCQVLGIQYTWLENIEAARLKGYYLIDWYCTDQSVGVMAIFLDDVLVAMSKQNSRKSKVEYEFVSEEAANKLRTLLATQNEPVPLIDREEEIGPFYTVSFSSQLMTDDGYFEGRPVKVTKKWEGYNRPSSDWKRIQIQDGDSKRVIDIEDFKIPIKAHMPARSMLAGKDVPAA